MSNTFHIQYEIFLKICKIKESATCTFCQISEETIEHLFWACPIINKFWQNLNICLQPYIDMSNSLNAPYILLGIYNDNSSDLLNLIIIIAKRYIYAQKCKDKQPTMRGAIDTIKIAYDIIVRDKKK